MADASSKGPQLHITISEETDNPWVGLSMTSRFETRDQVRLHAGADNTSVSIRSPLDDRRGLHLWSSKAVLKVRDEQRGQRLELRTGGEDEIEEPRLDIQSGDTARTLKAR